VSPILVRPVREQLEHDRVIRALQAKFKRKYDVAVNIGAEQVTPVKAGGLMLHPDLLLTSTGRNPRLAGIIEVETGESVNNLEALAQWAHFGKARVPFSLYVPGGSVDQARRLCADHAVVVDEIWSFHAVGSQLRFTLMYRAAAARPEPGASRARSASARRSKPAARAAAKRAKAKPVRRTRPTAARKGRATSTRSRKR
jgi:hypothetical protein